MEGPWEAGPDSRLRGEQGTSSTLPLHPGLPSRPHRPRKRALATLNDSGSERRPLTGKGKAEPGRRGWRRGDLAPGSARQEGARRGGRRGRGAAAPEVPAPWEEAQLAPSGRAGGKAPSLLRRAGAGGRGAEAPGLPGVAARPVPGTRPLREGGRGGGPAASSEAPRPGPRHRSHMASGVGAAFEELPHDGTCDECEPDEAPGAEEVCRECAFCYCHRHAEAHRQKFPSHRLAQYVHGAAPAWTADAPAQGDATEDAQAKVENERDVESEVGEESESEEDSESEEESETEEESEDESDEDSEDDSEEEMEDEQESEAEEDNQEGESEAEGETEAESEFDPEIEMEAERVAKRKCPDHGLDLSTYCQEDKQLICVLCPVIGTHQGHQLSTLDEAFEELRVSSGRREHRSRGQDTWVSNSGGPVVATFASTVTLRSQSVHLLGAVLIPPFWLNSFENQ